MRARTSNRVWAVLAVNLPGAPLFDADLPILGLSAQHFNRA